MTIIRSSHELRVSAPAPAAGIPDCEVWLASMSDSGWRVLTDFRNWNNWIPGIQSVQQADQEPPARGTLLQVSNGVTEVICSIDRWDPPRNLQFSMGLGGGEIAFDFHIEEDHRGAEIHLALNLERSLNGLAAVFAFFMKRRLRSLGKQVLKNLASRLRPARNL
ncbi:SRPBCC family protein [Gammaproteobacteria bacterium]|nr:SRPBCC family protein [Gammaproteobacteria bacterium]